MTDYRPIACALYSQYEVAVLHRTPLRLRWRDPVGVVHVEVLMPEDLETRNGEEFLLARTPAGEPRRVRLDRLATVSPPSSSAEP